MVGIKFSIDILENSMAFTQQGQAFDEAVKVLPGMPISSVQVRNTISASSLDSC